MSNGPDRLERFGKAVLGVGFHAVACAVGSLVLGVLISATIGVISSEAARAGELLVPALVSAVLALLIAPRLSRRSAPFTVVFGLVALYIGWRELYWGWSPTWSHQTRREYVLSQLFGIGGSCSDSECLYLPFLCLTTYGLVSLIALGLTRKTSAQ